MSFKLSLPPGSAFGLLSWLSVGVAAVAGDVAAAAAGVLLMAGVAVVIAAPPAPAPPVVLSTKLVVTGGAGGGPSVVGIELLGLRVGIDGLALLSSVIRISVGLVISLMVIFQLNPAG